MRTTGLDSNKSTYLVLLRLWSYVPLLRKFQFSLLLLVMLLSGAAELISLGAAFPFLASLNDPQQIWQIPLIQSIAIRFGLTKASQLLLPTMVIFAGTIFLASFIQLFNLWLNGRLAAALGSDLSIEAFRRTIYQPYSVHITRNSSIVVNAITAQVSKTVIAISDLLRLITSSIVSAAILIALLAIDATVAIFSAAFFGCVYLLVILGSRGDLHVNSDRIAFASAQRLKCLQEGLGGIRDVTLNGCQSFFVHTYSGVDRTQWILEARNRFLSAFPRFAVEAVSLMGIAALAGLLIWQKGPTYNIIPILGSLALGAQRLLPSLQQIYKGWASLKGFHADLVGVVAMLDQPMPTSVVIHDSLPLNNSIKLVDVHFRYSPNSAEILRGLDLEIYKGERVGIIGETGSGKSTCVDLIMGLLDPTAGCLMVDGNIIEGNRNLESLLAWRNAIAHVPQSIYLSDASIAENIAFGIPSSQIDVHLVACALRQAQLYEFIASLPDGLETKVGERGISLSGGQRQRIGLARAFYKRASVLVLDESTSALDVATESSVMDSLHGLSREVTILMVAHRLSTLSRCDRILHFKNGMVVGDGPPRLMLGHG